MGKEFLKTLTGNEAQSVPDVTQNNSIWTSKPLVRGVDSLVGGRAPAAETTGMFSNLNKAQILAGAAAGVSAFSHIAAGRADADMHELRAEQSDVLAENARQLGVEQEIAIRTRFNEAQNEAVASFAAGGIKGGATVKATHEAISQREESAVRGAKHTAKMNALSNKIESASSTQQAAQSSLSGLFGAFGEVSEFAIRKARRGKTK